MYPTSKSLTKNAFKGTGEATLINKKALKNKSWFFQSKVRENK